MKPLMMKKKINISLTKIPSHIDDQNILYYLEIFYSYSAKKRAAISFINNKSTKQSMQ